MKLDKRQLLALAGVVQAAHLVRQVARRGVADTDAMEASLGSVFKIDADSVEEIYGGIRGLSEGLRQLKNLLSSASGRDLELTRYVAGLLQLERKLSAQPAMLKTIAQGLETTGARLEHFPLQHGTIIAQLAELYSQTVSTLRPRIIVKGEPLQLSNPDNVNRIRALLLAGIRSAVLWKQCGGARWNLVFQRRGIVKSVEAILRDLADQGPAAGSTIH